MCRLMALTSRIIIVIKCFKPSPQRGEGRGETYRAAEERPYLQAAMTQVENSLRPVGPFLQVRVGGGGIHRPKIEQSKGCDISNE